MGCGGSFLRDSEDHNQDIHAALSEDEKAELSTYESLPNVTLIRGETIEKTEAKKRSDRSTYAMKELLRDDEWNPMLFKKEITILSILCGHDNILRYKEAYVNDTYFYINTRLCTGGELFDRVKKLKHFSEKQAVEVMTTIISAVQHIHSKGIVHRDLKPENIVYQTRKSDSDICIIDFGDAEQVESDSQIYRDFVGTPFYLAPECVRHRNGYELYKSDMWAVGVITYVLLTGRPPFWGRTNREILGKIIKGDIHWPSSIRLSDSCKNFIISLLRKDPRKRMSAKEALRHNWIRKEGPKHNEHLGDDFIANISKFQSASRLKRLIVTAMVRDMTDHDKQIIARAFHELDTDKNGYVDKAELITYLLSTGDLNRRDASLRAKELIHGMDMDGDGKIDLNEWLHGKTAEQLTSDSKLIDRQFTRILTSTNITRDDSDSSDMDSEAGTESRTTTNKKKRRTTNKRKMITTKEIHKSFGDLLAGDDLQEIIDEIDENKDGVIDLQEFQNAMQQTLTLQ